MEWNGIEKNGFNFIVVWMIKEGKERNGNNSCLDREKKRMEMNVV